MSELNCFGCGCVIGVYFSNGAPFNHMYYCECCGKKEQEEWEAENE